MIGQWAAVVRDPHRPIHPLLDHDGGHPGRGPHRIAVPVVGHRPGTTQVPGRLEAQDTGQIPARRREIVKCCVCRSDQAAIS